MAIVQQEEENIEQYVIPVNSDYDLNVAGYTFDMKRAIEGIILGLAFGTVGLLIFGLIPIRWTIKIAFIAMFAAVGVFLALKGVNGDSITDYFLNVLLFKASRRITYYNPRVKHEIKFFVSELGSEETMIPRERLEAMWHKYVSKKDTQQAHNNFFEDTDVAILFEDDIKVNKEKAKDVMTPLQKRKQEKEEQKAERKRKKQEAKIRKMNKKRQRIEDEF